MQEFKYTNEGSKLLKKEIFSNSITVNDFINELDINDVLPLIILIDQDCSDWSITESIFVYFSEEIQKLIKSKSDKHLIDDKTIKAIQKLHYLLIKHEIIQK